MLIAGIVHSGAGVMKEGDGRVSVVGFHNSKLRLATQSLSAIQLSIKSRVCSLAYHRSHRHSTLVP